MRTSILVLLAAAVHHHANAMDANSNNKDVWVTVKYEDLLVPLYDSTMGWAYEKKAMEKDMNTDKGGTLKHAIKKLRDQLHKCKPSKVDGKPKEKIFDVQWELKTEKLGEDKVYTFKFLTENMKRIQSRHGGSYEHETRSIEEMEVGTVKDFISTFEKIMTYSIEHYDDDDFLVLPTTDTRGWLIATLENSYSDLKRVPISGFGACETYGKVGTDQLIAPPGTEGTKSYDSNACLLVSHAYGDAPLKDVYEYDKKIVQDFLGKVRMNKWIDENYPNKAIEEKNKLAVSSSKTGDSVLKVSIVGEVEDENENTNKNRFMLFKEKSLLVEQI